MNNLHVFDEILKGSLNPFKNNKLKFKSVLEFVCFVNSQVAFSNVSTNQVAEVLGNFNPMSLGYRSSDDLDFKIKESTFAGKVNIHVFPKCAYELTDDIRYFAPPDNKSNLYLGLLCDAFERYKNRSIHFYSTASSSENIALYAQSNLQNTKTAARAARCIFQKSLKSGFDFTSNSDLHTLFYLNYFLIKVRMFIQKYFEHHIPKCIKTEDKLLKELFNIDPVTSQIFMLNNSVVPTYMNLVSVNEPQAEYAKFSKMKPKNGFDCGSTAVKPAVNKSTKKNEIVFDQEFFQSLEGFLKWNGPINSLIDAIYRANTEVKIDEQALLETDLDLLAKLLVYIGRDKNNHAFSYSTIKTILQPTRTDKRPKSTSKKRLDVNSVVPQK